jgi:type VI secretion system protein ImpG
VAAKDSFDSSFLAELRSLDSFRRRYSSEQPLAQLDAQDPDVQRMIEVLAFSAVRTRHAVLRNLSATWRRLLSGYFQALLRPLPAMGMLQAQVTARMTESIFLPTGTELRVVTADGFEAGFQTLADLQITPMTLDRLELLRGGIGHRVVLTFSTRIARAEAVGLLRLYLHYLDDYLAALTVHQQLAKHLHRAFVVYDAPVHDRSDGPACTVTFGRSYDEPYEADEQNPLAAVRSFFHFPEQELLVDVAIPPPSRPWTRLSLCLDLEPAWPRNPPVFRELFHPFVVPVRNLRRAPAQTIDCDGTKDSHPVRFMHRDASYQLLTVAGVYRITDQGLVPVPAATLGSSGHGYEIEYEPAPASLVGEQASLQLRLPEALLEPVRISVDGYWHQPLLAEHLTGRTSASLPERSLTGLELALCGPLRAGISNGLDGNSSALLQLLSLKMKAVLERSDLVVLLQLLDSVEAGPFRGFMSRVREVAVEVTPDETLRGAGIRHVYHLLTAPFSGEEEPLWSRFCYQLQSLLDAWDYEGRAEVVLHTELAQMPAPRLRRK